MEVSSSTKRNRKRAKRKKRSLNRKRAEQAKLSKRQKLSSRSPVAVLSKEKVKKAFFNPMDATAFWDNYEAAHDWQKRHNAIWWKTRCYALEHENRLLKDTIRKLVSKGGQHNISELIQNVGEGSSTNKEPSIYSGSKESDDDSFEFQLDEDMMAFLTQSLKHKIELKNKKESENKDREANFFNSEPGWYEKRNEEATLLYGVASPKILAMEAAHQASMQRHIDKCKPQYWPNIPLKL